MVEVSVSRAVDIDLILRTPQAEYLDFLAEREGISASRAFARIVEQYRGRQSSEPKPRSPRKIRKHFTVPSGHREFLESLATTLGVPASDAARRLIDDAMARDVTV